MSSQVSRLEDGQRFLYVTSHSTGSLFTVETCLNAWIAHVGQQQAMESVQLLKTASFISNCKNSLEKCQGILCAQQVDQSSRTPAKQGSASLVAKGLV